MEESVSPASLVLIAGVCAASFVTLFLLFQRHISGSHLMPYEPRRRVPWGPGIAVAALAFPILGVFVTVLGVEADESQDNIIPRENIVEQHTQEIDTENGSPDPVDADKFVVTNLSMGVMLIVLVAVIALFLRVCVHADDRDLGIPSSREEFLHDVGLGAIAALASIFPTFVLQLILTLLFEPEQGHPLVEEFQTTHTPAMLVVGLFMVVVAAPLFEEFSFRLLLQGWLEKWEDQTIGYSATVRVQRLAIVEENPEANKEVLSISEDAEPQREVIQPVRPPGVGVLADLPHGWFPILVSSVLFGLAHLGHGVSPLPLVLFGMVLGYLYQRTHRLVPSITAHALFNAYSMTLLWLNL
jgi:membrane protease YdiL (CAAX protease family)